MANARSLFAPVVLVALAVVPGCGDDDTITIIEDDPADDAVDAAVAEGLGRGELLADEVLADLSADDDLVQIGKTASILAALNAGQIDQAAFAAPLVAGSDVVELANQVLIDNENASIVLDEVVRFYGTGYIPSAAADAVTRAAAGALDELRAASPDELDFTFVELQVITTAQGQVVLDQLLAIVGDGAMGDYVEDTIEMNDDHLREAEDLLETFF